MKIVYKGRYTGEEQLPSARVPDDATKFEDTPDLKIMVIAFAVISLLLAAGITVASSLIRGEFRVQIATPWFFLGMVGVLLSTVPHELLHAYAYGKDAVVELYFSMKNLSAFVACGLAVPKKRYILSNFLPSLVLGWVPLILWAVIPFPLPLASFLFPFAVLNIVVGIGDYLNMYAASTQMPEGSYQVVSGNDVFWYKP